VQTITLCVDSVFSTPTLASLQQDRLYTRGNSRREASA